MPDAYGKVLILNDSGSGYDRLWAQQYPRNLYALGSLSCCPVSTLLPYAADFCPWIFGGGFGKLKQVSGARE